MLVTSPDDSSDNIIINQPIMPFRCSNIMSANHYECYQLLMCTASFPKYF